MTNLLTLQFEKKNHLFDRIYCIHLTDWEDSQARLQGFIDATQASDWSFGNILIYKAIDGVKTKKPFPVVHNGTWGCYKSHYNIIEECLNEDVQSVLILEDDIRFHENVTPIVKEYMSSLPKDWELIYFFNNPSGDFHPQTDIYGMYDRPLGTSAYALSRKGMERLYFILAHRLYNEVPEQTHGHIDQILANWVAQHDVKAYCTQTHTIGTWQAYPSCTSQTFLRKDSYLIPNLDVILTNHCNLSCKQCGQLHQKRFPKEPVDIDGQLRVLNAWFEKGLVVSELRLLGGEPFLLGADGLLRVFSRLREFHENAILLISNGVLLNQMPNWFFRHCHDLGVGIGLSNHTGWTDTSRLDEHEIRWTTDWDYAHTFAHEFDREGNPLFPNAVPETAWQNCPVHQNICYVLRNETLYRCSWHAARISVYNAGGLSEAWKENVSIPGCPKTASLQELKEYLQAEHRPECAGCLGYRKTIQKEQDEER
jgi:hypothetical protein